jgi:Tfp pilus assembly protein PilF
MISRSHPRIAFILMITFAALALLSGCSQSVRKVHPLITDSPALSQTGSSSDESSLARKEPKELVAAGYAYLAAGNTSLARLHFTYALKRDPKNAIAYLGLADIDYRSGDYPSAQGRYQRAEELDPRLIEATLGQAQALRQLGKLGAANEQITKALKLAPNDIRVLNELAINYDLQGQENLAANLYREIAQKAPDQAAIHNNIGVNYMSQGNYAEAIVNFSKAYLLDEKDVRIANNLAMAFALYGQEGQALKLFTRTVGEAAAWNNLGYLYMTQGHYDDAERALNKALELNPKFYERAQENLDRLNQLRSSADRR